MEKKLSNGQRKTAMKFAVRETFPNVGSFVFTTVCSGMLPIIILGMCGIYRGFIQDGTLRIHLVGVDLWIV